jgi:dsRNA-specific ribonuclease
VLWRLARFFSFSVYSGSYQCTFNPFGVDTLSQPPQVCFTWGYSYSTLSGLGPTWHLFPRLHLGLLSRVASYYVSYSTLSGLGPTWHLFPRFHLGLLSRVASYYVSYSTLSGLGPTWHLFPRLHLGLFIFNPFRVGAYLAPFPQVSPGAIHIQPLWGWGPSSVIPRLHLGLLSRYASYYVSYSTLSGLGPTWHLFPRLHLGLLSRYASYYVSYSTLSGLGPFFGHPQVAPGAIISRSELLRFIFNPFRVGALLRSSPGFTWGYYLATRVTTFHIQPLWGCQTKVWTAVQKPCCTGIDWRPRL